MRGARTLAWIAATGCCALGAPAGARAAIVDDNPAAAARGPGQVEVFLRSPSGVPWRSALTPAGTWTPWQALDGQISSGPGADADGGSIGLYARGTDNQLYGRGETGTTWSGWGLLGGSILSAPSVERRRDTPYTDVYVRWADNSIKQDTWTGTAWTGWLDVPGGGLTLAAPAATSRTSGVIDIFVRATDDSVDQIEWNGSAWSPWTAIGGSTADAPAVVTRTQGTMDLFVRGADDQIHWRTFNGAQWLPYQVIPGTVQSGPAAATDGTGRIFLFARGGGDALVNIFSSRTWSGWRPLHPAPPPARCSFSAGHMSAKIHTVAYGRHPHVSGRLVSAAGQPLNGWSVLARTPGGVVEGTGVTRPSGSYRMTLPKGHDRRIQVIASAVGVGTIVCSSVRPVRVRAGIRLSASRRVRPGGLVHFSGRLLGGPIPGHGKVVELQAFDGGRWRTFATPRARRGRHGRFRTAYRLRQTFGPRRFAFRARVRREADYPYVLGYSRTVRVRVL